MTIGNRAYAKIHNNKVDVLERMNCFSEKYTPNMEFLDVVRNEITGEYRGTALVMLELPTHLVKDAIDICEEVNAKYT